jgi:hypothetical protein
VNLIAKAGSNATWSVICAASMLKPGKPLHATGHRSRARGHRWRGRGRSRRR